MPETLQNALAIIIASSLPYIELRGAIPLAWRLGFSAPEAYWLAVIGNMIPVIPIMLLVAPVSRWLGKIPLLKRFFDWVFARSRRNEPRIRKYGFWGLAVFVAIPLPMTGVWTGAIIAFLLGIRKRIAFLSISLGVMLAGLIVLSCTYGIAHLLGR